MGYTRGRKMTKELVLELSKQYNSRGEMQRKDSSLYCAARKNGWLDEACSHMTNISYSIPQKIIQQIFETILNTKCKYNCRTIIKPYELDIYFKDYNFAVEYNGKGWHLNDTVDKAKLCNDLGIYLLVINEKSRKYENDIKEQIIENLKIINKNLKTKIKIKDIENIIIDYSLVYPKINWEDIQQKINSCKNIADFGRKYLWEYNMVRKFKKFNMLDDIRERTIYSSKDEILEECRKITDYKIFIEQHLRLYLKVRKLGILDEATSHMFKRYSKENGHGLYKTFEDCKKAADGMLSKKELQVKNPKAYNAAHRLGYINDIFGYSGRIPASKLLNKESCLEESKKYTSIKLFKQKSYRYWRASVEHNLIPEIEQLYIQKRLLKKSKGS